MLRVLVRGCGPVRHPSRQRVNLLNEVAVAPGAASLLPQFLPSTSRALSGTTQTAVRVVPPQEAPVRYRHLKLYLSGLVLGGVGLSLVVSGTRNNDHRASTSANPSISLGGQQLDAPVEYFRLVSAISAAEDASNDATGKEHLVGCATAALLWAPAVQLVHGQTLSTAQLSNLQSILASRAPDLQPWEAAMAVWSLACLGPPPGRSTLAPLTDAAVRNLPQLAPQEAAALAWGLAMFDALQPAVLKQVLEHVSQRPSGEVDDVTLLLLLQAAMLGRPEGADARARSLRGSWEETEARLSSASERLRVRCRAAYQEYVPFHPCITHAYSVLLPLASVLPRVAPAVERQHLPGSSGAAGYQQLLLGSFSQAEAAAAAGKLQDHRHLSRVKRDMLHYWRSDELLGQQQQVVNEAAFLLQRRLGLAVSQGQADVDIVLPQHSIAIFVEGASSVQQGPSTADGAHVEGPAANAPGGVHLEELVSNMLAGRMAPASVVQAHRFPSVNRRWRQDVEERGWRVGVVRVQEWRALKGEEAKLAYLRRLLSR